MFIFIAQTKDQSQTKKYTKQLMYNITLLEQQAAAKRPMVFESSSNLECFIECLNKEHQKEIKQH